MNFSRNPQTCYSTRPSDARATPRDHQCCNERRWEDRTLRREGGALEQRGGPTSGSPPSSRSRCDSGRCRNGPDGRPEAHRESGVRERSESVAGRPRFQRKDAGTCPRPRRHRSDLDRDVRRLDSNLPSGGSVAVRKGSGGPRAPLGAALLAGIKMVLVEGGSTVIWSFLRDGLADELRVFISSRVLGGQSAPTIAGGLGVSSVEGSIPLRLERSERLGDGILLEYTVVR